MHGAGIFRKTLHLAVRAARREAGLAPLPLAPIAGMGRRRFLQSLAASAGAAAIPVHAQSNPGRVVIIGGGIAGLNALRILRDAGVDATLYEARKRTGGRMWTIEGALVPGLAVDAGGQFVNSDHADIIGLCQRYGLSLIDRKASVGIEQIVRDALRVDPAQVAADLAPLAAQIVKDSAALDARYAKIAAVLDPMSVSQYLDAHAGLIPQDYVRRLVEQGIRTEYGVEPGEASALELIFNLPTVDGQTFETLGASDERYVIAGGSQKLTDAMTAALAERIELDRPVISITRLKGQYLLRFRDGRTTVADRIILAIPAALMKPIVINGPFNARWQAFASEVGLGLNEKLNAAYAARPWQATMGPAGSSWDASATASFAEVWEASIGQPGDPGVLTWFLGGAQTAATKPIPLRARMEFAVGTSMGDLTGAALPAAQLTAWQKDPMTRGAYVNFRPGQLTRFGRQLWIEEDGVTSQIARSGGIYIAGEHVSDAFPGFMEGGAQTGRMAAQAILDGR